MTGEDVAARVHAYAWTDRKPGLERTRALLAALGNPEKALKFVHITGSNGKGSTAAMLASVLAAAGYRTGLFTSPHLYRFNERFQVNGTPIPDAALDRLAERVLAAADTLPEHPTEFELMTAIGFLWFAEAGCDLVVVEVGLGGRLDSTNVIPAPEAAVITNIGLEHIDVEVAVIETGLGGRLDATNIIVPVVSVITNIGLEHIAILGSTLAAIAAEKSGILKPGCRAVLYGQSREVGEVVARVCAEKKIPLTVTDASQLTLLSSGLDGQHFTYRGSAPLLLPLLGDYQLRNAMTVLDTVDALRAQGRNISADAVAHGLAAARWPGRLELVRRRPDLIIDGGHNPQCAQALAASLRGLYVGKKLIFLIGVLADKDWQSMVGEVLPLAKAIVTVRPESERAKDENELDAWARAQGVPAEAHASIGEALDAALALAGPEDAVCAWGSLYSVGELRHCLGLC